MDIVVCIKQVVAGDRVKIDPRTYNLVRSAEFSYINPLDLFAIEMAVQLKKEQSATITAVTMGPQISEEVLWEALTLGADRAVLLSDPRFSASDTLATSYVLGMGIRKIGKFDLILCGMRTTDGDTGQVGPQLAEELDVPYISAVEKVKGEKGSFRVERVSDGFREIVEVSVPALFTISSKTAVRLPSLIAIQDTFTRNSIECWNLEDLNADPDKVGRAGSGTWVEGLTPTAQKKSCVLIEGDPRQQARILLSKLLEKNLLS
ncbi:MAG TPA: electron transfer flavoprotein subunit beta/FixA family protein [Thermodesulfobacteriota bacterium]|nr:electron transfer flavoprotein subunit beta/FixA family protein [Thermodesulfobacteriota bacterium]